jgi:hypothetical protein
MPSKRSGCRGPKLRSFFKVDDQTSRRRSLGESESPEAVAMLLRLAGFPGNVCPVAVPGRSVRTLVAHAYLLCGALNKTSSTNAGRNAKRIPRVPSPVSIETMFLIEFKPFLGV